MITTKQIAAKIQQHISNIHQSTNHLVTQLLACSVGVRCQENLEDGWLNLELSEDRTE
jgi:hypothetical protein